MIATEKLVGDLAHGDFAKHLDGTPPPDSREAD
jgi:hypothetical protein